MTRWSNLEVCGGDDRLRLLLNLLLARTLMEMHRPLEIHEPSCLALGERLQLFPEGDEAEPVARDEGFRVEVERLVGEPELYERRR